MMVAIVGASHTCCPFRTIITVSRDSFIRGGKGVWKEGRQGRVMVYSGHEFGEDSDSERAWRTGGEVSR